MEQTQRLKAIPFTGAALAEMLQTGHEAHVRCVDGLPAGAKFIGVRDDPYRHGVMLVFEHESFEPLEAGDIMPYVQPVLMSLGCQPYAPVDLKTARVEI